MNAKLIYFIHSEISPMKNDKIVIDTHIPFVGKSRGRIYESLNTERAHVQILKMFQERQNTQ